jgi:hypothetical protein
MIDPRVLDKFDNPYERLAKDPYFKAVMHSLSVGDDVYGLLDTVLKARYDTEEAFREYSANDVREVVIKVEKNDE